MRLFGDSVCHATEPNINVITRCVEGVVSNSAGTAQAYALSITAYFWCFLADKSTQEHPRLSRAGVPPPAESPPARLAQAPASTPGATGMLHLPVVGGCCSPAQRLVLWILFHRKVPGWKRLERSLHASRRSGTYISSGSRCLLIHTDIILSPLTSAVPGPQDGSERMRDVPSRNSR